MKLDELWLKTRRGVLYALYLIGALLVQNVILSHVALFGVRAMFLPALVVAAALFEGGWGGGLFGLAAGILSDLFFGSQSVLFTVLFPVMGFIAGFLPLAKAVLVLLIVTMIAFSAMVLSPRACSLTASSARRRSFSPRSRRCSVCSSTRDRAAPRSG